MKFFAFSLLASLSLVAYAGTPEAMVILKSNCFSCHNSEKEKGGLDLTTRKSLLRGGDEGKVVVPGKAAASRLIQSLQPGADPHMPPKGQLSPRSISALESWVNNGAFWDENALKDRPSPARKQLKQLPPGYLPSLTVSLSPDVKRLEVGQSNIVMF